MPLDGWVVVAGGGVVDVVDLVLEVMTVVDGAGSNAASTQYDRPDYRVVHVAGMEGFWRSVSKQFKIKSW